MMVFSAPTIVAFTIVGIGRDDLFFAGYFIMMTADISAKSLQNGSLRLKRVTEISSAGSLGCDTLFFESSDQVVTQNKTNQITSL